MRFLPEPHFPDEGPSQSTSRAVWALVFLGLGTTILATQPPEGAGRFIIVAAVSYAAAAWFLYLLLVRRDQ